MLKSFNEKHILTKKDCNLLITSITLSNPKFYSMTLVIDNLLKVEAFNLENSLFFMTTIQFVPDEKIISAVTQNVFLNRQVYFPVSFTKFYKETSNVVKNETAERRDPLRVVNKGGSFDIYSYDDCAFYLSDYKMARRRQLSDGSSIGENHDGSDIYDLFLKNSNLNILRAVEARLVKNWYLKPCLNSLSNVVGYNSTNEFLCEKRNAHVLGPRDEVNYNIFDN